MAGRERETFTERFNRLTSELTDPELIYALRITTPALHKLRNGETKSLKLEAGLRLAARLGITPYELAGIAELPSPKRPASADPIAASPDLSRIQSVVEATAAGVAQALEALEALTQVHAPQGRRVSGGKRSVNRK